MTDKLALVVGASRGLGLAYTKELAARGWKVIATARNPGAADALNALAGGSEGAIEVEALDSKDRAGLGALAAKLSGRTLDLLMVVAGIAGPTGDELGPPISVRTQPGLTDSTVSLRSPRAMMKERVMEFRAALLAL